MLKARKPTSAGTRHQVSFDRGLTTSHPEKALTSAHKQNSGRNAHGHVTTRHRGGGDRGAGRTAYKVGGEIIAYF